ncbi:MAG: glycosyltransferase [Planctomycetota bacterium]|jgi:glycosyltransferase involved in cell wall biosynthesis
MSLKSSIKSWVKPVDTKGLVSPFNYRLLFVEPLVIYVKTARYLKNLHFMSRHLQDREVVYLVQWSWAMETADRVRYLQREWKRHATTFKKHHIVFMGNNEKSVEMVRAAGMDSRFVNQSCFLDENRFKMIPGAEKKRDAILNSRMGPYKRHWLAKDVASLAIVTAPQKPDYELEMRELLAHADWLNYPGDEYQRLQVPELVEEINASRVGLILSQVEGACFASTEYLACGVPVVSTESMGGRDAFFDPAYTVIAEDSASSVAEAVEELKKRQLTPEFIRAETVKKLQEHRIAFCEMVNGITEANPPLQPAGWFEKWGYKLRQFCEPSEFADRIEKDMEALGAK